MKYIFTPKKKGFKSEKEIIYQSDAPLKQDKSNWYVIDNKGIRRIIKKKAYTIKVEK